MDAMRDGAGPPHRVVPSLTWQQQQGRPLWWLAAAARKRAQRQLYNNTLPLYYYYSTFFPSCQAICSLFSRCRRMSRQSVCVVSRLRRLICFPRRASTNESVFIILFESSKTLREAKPHVDIEITR